MVDRSPIYVHIYACPEDQRGAAATVLGGFGLDFEFEYQAAEANGALSLTAPYFEMEFPCDRSADVAAALRGAAPGCSYFLWEEPGTTGPGWLHAYTPRLGPFCAASIGSEAVFTPSQITAFLATGGRRRWRRFLPVRRATIARDLHRAMGGPWADDWQHRHGLAAGPAATAAASDHPWQAAPTVSRTPGR